MERLRHSRHACSGLCGGWRFRSCDQIREPGAFSCNCNSPREQSVARAPPPFPRAQTVSTNTQGLGTVNPKKTFQKLRYLGVAVMTVTCLVSSYGAEIKVVTP